ncbi:MAG: TolC family protein, partial [Verrucomicrobia bacterium]|nr:TolC family protein [Verrucomicrobiota bacterium]
AAIQVRAAKEGVRIAKSDFYPTWSVNGSIGRSDDDSLIPKNDQWSVGTAISYPLFTGGQHWYGVRGAKADQRKAEDTLNDTENQMVATLEDRFVAWQDAAERTEVQNEFLKAAEVRAEIARAQYQNGLLSFEDWDLIENDLIDKQKSVLISQRDAVVARAGWEKALGTGVIP